MSLWRGLVNSKQFRRYLDRDEGCIHCGELEAVAPHHRLNRGMGGSKLRDEPANIVVLCSVINGLIESDAVWALIARQWGWKLRPYEDPLEKWIWYSRVGEWYLLDNDYGRVSVADHTTQPEL